MKLCERCHKEREDSDFAQIASIGVFCSWCREYIQIIIDQQGEDAARTWVYSPRHDMLDLIEGEGKHVLDCGCWAGYTLEELEKRGHIPEGLDIWDNRTVAKHVPFHYCDLETQPEYWAVKNEMPPSLYNKKFDYILFGDVIEHLVDHTFAFHLAKEVLNEGGKVIISVPNMGWIGAVLPIANQHFYRDESGHFDKTHLRFYTRDVLGKTLVEAGFNHVKMYSKQLPDATPWPEGATGEQQFQWDNLIVTCNRDLFEQLNTYQILAVAWA